MYTDEYPERVDCDNSSVCRFRHFGIVLSKKHVQFPDLAHDNVSTSIFKY